VCGDRLNTRKSCKTSAFVGRIVVGNFWRYALDYSARAEAKLRPGRGELAKMGLIYDSGRRQCRVTHSQAHAYKAKNPVLPPARETPKEPNVEGQPQLFPFDDNLAQDHQ
jgi:hypothetical protein